ncbi:helix-turn-helix domain-containing protein [Acinetobacter sp. YH12110]|uniref:helix-turn-helix domain-containing protein n=1 Tax=Acinetobacter sp. YH12110 TaxID=2601097 RepID=UPI0015D36997|nr:helix-turn-helix transcriptional regulator [Acinetobacter sp. YH12110]
MDEPRHESVSILVALFKKIREIEGLTIEQVADLAGIHRTSLGLIERNERQPTLGVAMKVANALNYELSDLLTRVELVANGNLKLEETIKNLSLRLPSQSNIRNADKLFQVTGLKPEMLLMAIQEAYNTVDLIDAELTTKGLVPISKLVELANLSSMLGNIIGGTIAEASDNLYERNKPHHYPDLLPLDPTKGAVDLELKMALEKNRPKGHLPKAGTYISFRYILGNKDGSYTKGKDNRGDTVWIWEVKVGQIKEEDFDLSNTEGDSGKTAVIKTKVFNEMPLVYFDEKYCPYAVKDGKYPCFN